MRWIVMMMLALSACASTKPVPQESDGSVKQRLDAEHREAQGDYDKAKAEAEAKP